MPCSRLHIPEQSKVWISLQLTFVFAHLYQEVQQLLQQLLEWSHHVALGTVTTWVSGTELVLTICFCGCFGGQVLQS